MTLSLLFERTPDIEKLEFIFDTFIPDESKVIIFEYAQWLDSDPEYFQDDDYRLFDQLFPDWPSELKTYASRFHHLALDLLESMGLQSNENFHIAWTNLLKAIAIGGERWLYQADDI